MFKAQNMISTLIEKGYTQTEIAKQANVSQSTIYKIKAGQIQDCLYNTAKNIETFYKEVLRRESRAKAKQEKQP